MPRGRGVLCHLPWRIASRPDNTGAHFALKKADILSIRLVTALPEWGRWVAYIA